MTDTTVTPDVYRELGTAQALLEMVAEGLAPSPGGGFRVRLTAGTAERIHEVVAGFRTDRAMGSDQAQPVDGGPW